MMDQLPRAITFERMECLLAPGGTFYVGHDFSPLPGVEKVVRFSVSLKSPELEDDVVVTIKTHCLQVVGKAPNMRLASQSDARNTLVVKLRYEDLNSRLARDALKQLIEQICNIIVDARLPAPPVVAPV